MRCLAAIEAPYDAQLPAARLFPTDRMQAYWLNPYFPDAMRASTIRRSTSTRPASAAASRSFRNLADVEGEPGTFTL